MPAGHWFVTECRRCGRTVTVEVGHPPADGVELEAFRARAAAGCPAHEEISPDMLRRAVMSGEVVLAKPVLDELRERARRRAS